MLPEFLFNRPRYFVEHCKEKLNLAEEIEKCHIKSSDTEGVLEVKSGSLSKTWYQAQLATTMEHPPHASARHGSGVVCFASSFFAIFLALSRVEMGETAANLSGVAVPHPRSSST